MLKTKVNNRTAWIASLTALIVVLGGLVAIQVRRSGVANVFTGGNTYRNISVHLAESGRYSVDGVHPTGYRPPAYPLLLAGIHWLWGSGAALAGLLANLAMDVGCLVLLLVLLHRLTRNPNAVLLAGLVFAIDIAFHLEALSQRETMLYTLCLLAFFVAAGGAEIEFGALLMMAISAALAWLTRPTGIALVPLLVIAAWFQTSQRGVGIRIARVVAACCVFATIILPWQWFLYRSFNEPVPAGTTSSGLNLFQGNNPAADAIIPYVDIDAYLPVIEQQLDDLGIPEHDEPARSRRMKADAIAYIKAKPIAFLRRGVVKVLALYSPVPTPLGTGTIETTADGVVLQRDPYHLSVWNVLITLHGLVLLGLTGLAVVRWRRVFARRPRAAVLIVGYIVLVTGLHAITFAETRFRLPLDPLLIAIGATAMFQASRACTRRSEPQSQSRDGREAEDVPDFGQAGRNPKRVDT